MSINILNKQLPSHNYFVGSWVLPDGLGDAASAMKVANLLYAHGVPKDQIFFVSNTPDKVALFNKNEFRLLSFNDMREAKKTHQFAIQIFASSSLADVACCVAHDIPMLVLYEYGNTNIPLPEAFEDLILTKSMGLDALQDEIGILIDPELKGWGFSGEAADPLKRIHKLDQATSSLQKAILGEELNFQEFVEKNLLYIAYPKNEKFSKGFALTLAKLNVQDQKNIVLFLPGERHMSSLSTFNDPDWANTLSALGIPTIKLCLYDRASGDVKAQVLHQKEVGNAKALTIITGNVSHEDMRLLWMASEKEVVCCGDGSLDEACSANKAIFFEARDHKKAMANSLAALYRHAKQGYAAEQMSLESDRYSLSSDSIANAMSRFFQANKSNGYQDITKLNRSICENCDCTDRVVTLIEEVLLRPRMTLTNLLNKTITDWNKELPLNAAMLISLDQVAALKICVSSGLSEREELRDSHFSTYSLANRTYLIKRT